MEIKYSVVSRSNIYAYKHHQSIEEVTLLSRYISQLKFIRNFCALWNSVQFHPFPDAYEKRFHIIFFRRRIVVWMSKMLLFKGFMWRILHNKVKQKQKKPLGCWSDWFYKTRINVVCPLFNKACFWFLNPLTPATLVQTFINNFLS